MTLFSHCDEGIEVGDLVEVSSYAGLPYLLYVRGQVHSEQRLLPEICIFHGHHLLDLGVDKETLPLVLLDGLEKFVVRGCVRRVAAR